MESRKREHGRPGLVTLHASCERPHQIFLNIVGPKMSDLSVVVHVGSILADCNVKEPRVQSDIISEKIEKLTLEYIS